MVLTSFIARLYRRFLEAQKRRAEREIAMHRHLLPHDREVYGNRLIHRSEDALPFGR